MDVQSIVEPVVVVLAPALPFLLGIGGLAGQQAVKVMTEDAWKQAKGVWGRLHPTLEKRPELEAAIIQVASQRTTDPKDQLTNLLTELLKEEPDLVAELATELSTNTFTTTHIHHNYGGNSFSGPVNVTGKIVGRDSIDHSGDMVGKDQIKKSQ